MYAVDPLSPLSIYNRASVHFYEGEYDDALALFQKNIDDNPEFALTYAGLSSLKALPPYGQLDESFKYSTTARAYGRDSRALGILLLRALDLQLEDLADHYFTQLKNQYRSSYEYISYIPYYSIFKKDYSYLQEDMFEYIDENDLTIPSFSFYISLLHYGNNTGDYDRVLSEFRKFEPGFFEEEIPALEIETFPKRDYSLTYIRTWEIMKGLHNYTTRIAERLKLIKMSLTLVRMVKHTLSKSTSV